MDPVLPDYQGACVTNIVPTLLAGPAAAQEWFPDEVLASRQVVLLVLDGLGWHQLASRPEIAPVLSGLAGSHITTIAPSTTATGLTSITTGLPPGEHGMVGYRVRTHGTVMNALRWQRDDVGDARDSVTPTEFQPHEPFLGSAATVITKAEFETTGFTHAHLRGATWSPWSTPSQIVPRVTTALEHGAQLVYAYYDGVDKVAHMSGFGQHYDTELALVDRLVGLLADALPPGAALLVTADHGQVEAPSERTISGDLGRMLSSMSGEGRFRWLHASPGAAPEVAAAVQDEFGDIAWIASVEQVRDEGWFGPRLSHEAASRLGDVAVVPHAPVAVHDPHDRGASHLVCRHGSLTADEMHVPLLWATK